MKNKKFNWVYCSSAFILLVFFTIFSPFWYDDACHSLSILGIINTGKEAFPTSHHQFQNHSLLITVGPIWNYWVAAWAKIFGWNLHLLRIPSLIISCLLLLKIFQYTENQININRGFWASILVLANVQFLTYGTQLLGEVPALFFIWLCLYYLSQWLQKFQTNFMFLSIIFANFAILTKEYIALPLGLTYFFLLFQIPKERKIGFIFAGLSLLIGPIIYYWIKFQNFTLFLEYWQLKSHYSNEFFNFSNESFRYILFKPLIFFGMIAAWLRFYFIENKQIKPYFFFFNLHFVFFLLSAGYDRFAIFVIPFSAFFLSDWMYYFWINSKSIFQKSIFVFIFILLFAQNTPIKIFQLINNQPNNKEVEVVSFVRNENKKAFSFELNIVAFLPQQIETSSLPPCLHSIQPPIHLQHDFLYILGPYSDTEFVGKIDEKLLKIVFSNEQYRVGILK